MTITNKLLREAIATIGRVDGIEMNPTQLVEDVIALSRVFTTEDRFLIAVAQTINELNLLASGNKKGHPLDQNHAGILSLPYQSLRKNGQKADLRIAYVGSSPPLVIWSFGHRYLPVSFYKRLQIRKEEDENRM